MSGYVLSGDADADLQDIFSFGIVTWGEKRATKYIYDIYEKLNLVGFNADIGRARPELHLFVRALPHGSHVLFFMPWRGGTLIVRILHGAADHQRAFEGYDPLASVAAD